MSFWYIASAYTHYPNGRQAAFEDVAAQAALLMEAGVAVFCPITHSHPISAHLSPERDTHEHWMAADAPFMAAAKGLIVCQLPGWDESRGVAQELAAFKAAGKPVLFMTPGEVPRECLTKRHRLIAFSGYASAGKDTAAQALIDLGYERVAFADAVRDAVLNLDPIIDSGLRLWDVVQGHGWEAAKKYPEVRRLLQRMGTEAGRYIHGSDCWINIARRKIEAAGCPVVITDCRFGNEAVMVRELGGTVVRIDRPGVGPKNDHASERLAFEPDCIIANCGTVAELHERVLSLADMEAAHAH